MQGGFEASRRVLACQDGADMPTGTCSFPEHSPAHFQLPDMNGLLPHGGQLQALDLSKPEKRFDLHAQALAEFLPEILRAESARRGAKDLVDIGSVAVLRNDQ